MENFLQYDNDMFDKRGMFQDTFRFGFTQIRLISYFSIHNFIKLEIMLKYTVGRAIYPNNTHIKNISKS